MDSGSHSWTVSNFLRPGLKNHPFGMLILNQPILTDPGLIKSLWTSARFRFTVDGGTNRWLKFIEDTSGQALPLPDIISGDFDSITDQTREYFKRKGVTFIETPDQDATDFTKALQILMSKVNSAGVKLHHILSLVTNSGRVDHIMANLETLHTARSFLNGIPLVLMSSNSLTWLLRSGSHEIHVPEHFVSDSHAVGLIPLLGPTNLTTSGLKWDLDNRRTAFGELVSTSNTFNKKNVKIKCDQDLIWTVQYTTDEI